MAPASAAWPSVALEHCKKVEQSTTAGRSLIELNGIEDSGIELRGMELNGIELNGMELRGIELNGMELRGIELKGIELRGIELSGDEPRLIELNGMELSGLLAKEIELNGIELSGEELKSIELRGIELRGMELRGIELSGTPARARVKRVTPLSCGAVDESLIPKLAQEKLSDCSSAHHPVSAPDAPAAAPGSVIELKGMELSGMELRGIELRGLEARPSAPRSTVSRFANAVRLLRTSSNVSAWRGVFAYGVPARIPAHPVQGVAGAGPQPLGYVTEKIRQQRAGQGGLGGGDGGVPGRRHSNGAERDGAKRNGAEGGGGQVYGAERGGGGVAGGPIDSDRWC